jgi:hypothetical protein
MRDQRFPSAISPATRSRRSGGGRRSKQPVRSASTTTRHPWRCHATRCAIAVWHLRCLRKPCEESGKVGSTIGALRARMTSWAPRHRPARIPHGRHTPCALGRDTRLRGIAWEAPDCTSRLSATRCSASWASHLGIDAWSRPAAPRWRLTALQAWRMTSGVSRPVRACTRRFRGATLRRPVIRRDETTRGAGVRITWRLF